MFVMDCYGHKLSNGVLFAHHLILDVPAGSSSHLRYRRRVPQGHNPTLRVPVLKFGLYMICFSFFIIRRMFCINMRTGWSGMIVCICN